MEHKRINILGTAICDLTMDKAIEQIDEWISEKSKNYVCVTSMHGVMESLKDEELREIHNKAGMVTPDGRSVVWLSKLKGHWKIKQVCGPELFPKVCGHSINKGYKHFYYGGDSYVPELLKKNMQNAYPGLKVTGTYSPPFRPLTKEEDDKIIKMINDSEADILWVGLSTPKQERWMDQHIGKLNCSVMLGIGAAFDIHAGLKNRCPLWISKIGLEWLYRTVQEPKRLAKRYFTNIPKFGFYVLLDFVGIYKAKPINKN